MHLLPRTVTLIEQLKHTNRYTLKRIREMKEKVGLDGLRWDEMGAKMHLFPRGDAKYKPEVDVHDVPNGVNHHIAIVAVFNAQHVRYHRVPGAQQATKEARAKGNFIVCHPNS